jgi:hypothetical protein
MGRRGRASSPQVALPGFESAARARLQRFRLGGRAIPYDRTSSTQSSPLTLMRAMPQKIPGCGAAPRYTCLRSRPEIAENLPEEAWKTLKREARYEVKTSPRARPHNVKQEIIERREFEDIRLIEEHVAEFSYRPTACDRDYRVVAVWKDVEVHKGQKKLFDKDRCFFYITNDQDTPADEIDTKHANQRCNQENLIEQNKNGVHALTAPFDNLTSNWAYMVIASLAWSLKAWSALLLPVNPRWKERHESEKQRLLRMEFPTFRQAMINIPAQIIRGGHRLVYRILSWNPWQPTFFRLWDQLRKPLRC